jgi:hypothetical protein
VRGSGEKKELDPALSRRMTTEEAEDDGAARNAPYSTVTDLARLRGWSTSVPLNTAV